MPTRRRQVITKINSVWLSGRALDSERAERQFKSLCLCFSWLFFFAVREFKSLPLLFCFFFLLYCCTAVVLLLFTHGGFVGCWWMGFSAVYCCALPLRGCTTYCCTAVVVYCRWVGRWVDRFVGVSMCSWGGGVLFFSPATPTPRWHSSACH